jgi:hypothetical protein
MAVTNDNGRTLTEDELDMIEQQYYAALEADADGGFPPGEHWILIGTLNQIGFRVLSKERAYEVAVTCIRDR